MSFSLSREKIKPFKFHIFSVKVSLAIYRQSLHVKVRRSWRRGRARASSAGSHAGGRRTPASHSRRRTPATHAGRRTSAISAHAARIGAAAAWHALGRRRRGAAVAPSSTGARLRLLLESLGLFLHALLDLEDGLGLMLNQIKTLWLC